MSEEKTPASTLELWFVDCETGTAERAAVFPDTLLPEVENHLRSLLGDLMPEKP